MPRGPLICTLSVLLLLVACASSPTWTNPDVPKARWSADLSACRRMADDQLGPEAYVTPGDERTGDPMKLADRTRNTKHFEAAVADCMEAKGYRPVQ
jgi:hypothetical protein